MEKNMKRLCLIALITLMVGPAFAAGRAYDTTGPDGKSSLTPPFSDYVYNYSLAANTAESITWPTNANRVNLACQAPYWVRVGGTAAVPVADVVDGTGSALNSAQRRRGSESSVSIISATAQVCSAEFWYEKDGVAP
jgi:hypothetical protein